MTHPFPDITLDVNLLNPGQFFACCGILELAARRWRRAEAWFGDSEFHVTAAADEPEALRALLDPLLLAESIVEYAEDAPHFGARVKPLLLQPIGLRLDWWLRPGATEPEALLRLWAGHQAPYDIVRDLHRACLGTRGARVVDVPRDRGALAWRRPLSGRFGFDPGPAWRALDVGFSPNDQGLDVLTAPLTELLAAVGLQRFRPSSSGDRRLQYAAWSHPLPPLPAAAYASGLLGGRRYTFTVVNRKNPDARAVPGKDYQSFGYAEPAYEEEP